MDTTRWQSADKLLRMAGAPDRLSPGFNPRLRCSSRPISRIGPTCGFPHIGTRLILLRPETGEDDGYPVCCRCSHAWGGAPPLQRHSKSGADRHHECSRSQHQDAVTMTRYPASVYLHSSVHEIFPAEGEGVYDSYQVFTCLGSVIHRSDSI